MTTDIEYEILQLTRKAMVKAKESPGNQATLKKVLEDYLDDKKSGNQFATKVDHLNQKYINYI